MFLEYSAIKFTDKAIEELHKIYALGVFLKNFGVFADKNIDEIAIWESDSSYACFFGLNTKSDLKYTKIFSNSYFTLNYEIELIKYMEINKDKKEEQD